MIDNLISKVKTYFNDAPSDKIFKVTIISTVVFFAIVVIIAVIPIFFKDSFNFIKIFLSEIKTQMAWITGGIFTALGTIIALLKFKKNEQFSLIGRIAIFIFAAFCFFIFPLIAVGVSSAVYEAIDSSEPDGSELSSPQNIDTPSSPIETKVIFDISFDDPLLKAFDIEIIKEYKNELIEQIAEKLFSNIEINSNLDVVSYSYYEKYVIEADDFEKAYINYEQEGLFKTHHQEERTDNINKSIELRKAANTNYVYSENQKLIAYRYIELGDEYALLSKTENMLNAYDNAIFWLLTAIQTAYSENNSNLNAIAEMLDDTIACYEKMAEKYNSESDEYMRTEIMADIYTAIKDNYT